MALIPKRTSLRFNAALVSGMALVAAILSFLYLGLGHYDESDKLVYQNLMQGMQFDQTSSSNEGADYMPTAAACARVAAGGSLDLQTSRHKRLGLQKEIYFEKSGERLLFKILGEESVLAFEKSDGKLRTIEQISNVTCYLQEECFWMLPNGRVGKTVEDLYDSTPESFADLAGAMPMQKVVIIQADDAVYHYHDDIFVADKVKVQHVLLPTHLLDNIVMGKQNYVLYADRAIYKRDGEDAVSKITLYESQDGLKCRFTSSAGDKIIAKEVEIDPEKHQVALKQPLGAIYNGQGAVPVEFASRSLYWDEENDTLLLVGDVAVFQEGIGNLATVDEVKIVQGRVEGKRVLKSIDTRGETVLNYGDNGAESSHVLGSKGPFRVDHEKMETRIYGLADISGRVTDENQVHFKDQKGEIYADRALIKYGYNGQELAPQKIVMLGNVKILNQLTSISGSVKPVLQYVMAERVEYYPATKEMVFTAKDGKRVLLYDKVNNLQVSAPTLKIVRDKETKKETVQGIGDVRFRFIENEFEQIRTRFGLDKLSKKASL